MPINAVLIDSREPQWVQDLTFGGLPTVVTMLDYGDVVATTDDGAMLAIERKTPGDLLNTLKEDRLFPQMAGLHSLSPWAYLVITGEFQRGPDGKAVVDRGPTGWSWAAVQGALLTVQEMGVFVVFAGGDTDFEAAVLRIGNRQRSAEMVIAPARTARILAAGEQIIAALPGIGLEKTVNLLETYSTPATALAALTCMVAESAPGIGAGIKANIRKALGLADWAELAVIMTSDRVAIERQLGIHLDVMPFPKPDIRKENHSAT